VGPSADFTDPIPDPGEEYPANRALVLSVDLILALAPAGVSDCAGGDYAKLALGTGAIVDFPMPTGLNAVLRRLKADQQLANAPSGSRGKKLRVWAKPGV